MYAPTLPVKTERLNLRPFEVRDVAPVYAMRSREEVNRYLYSSPLSWEEATRMVEERTGRTAFEAAGDWLALAVELSETGEMVGDVTLQWVSSEHQQGEIGFILHPGHRGRGYATEAATEMLCIGFEGLALHRIVARCDGRNEASIKVSERLGMRREAHLIQNEFVKGEWTDEVVYAMLAIEWEPR